MNLYLYLERKSFFHSLDPRTKIFLLFVTFVIGLFYQHPLYSFSVFILVLLHGLLSKSLINLKAVWKLILLISFLTILIWSLTANGRTHLFWKVSVESFLYGISSAIKISLMIIAGVIFLSTTKNEEISLGLIKMGIPYRMSFAFSTALRLVPMLAGTGATVIQAQRSRGLDLDEGNILERIKKYIPLLVPIFLSTIRNTNLLAQALESKGFGYSGKRTFYIMPEFKTADYLLSFFLIMILATAIYLKVKGYGRIEGLNI